MKVSVITACYNSEKTIESAIQSVLSQEDIELEYIIIDGMSKDRTVEIVKSYGDKISVFISEPDKGIYDALNKGIHLASGDIVGFLHSDDFYFDTKSLKRIVDKYNADSSLQGVYGDLIYVSADDTNKVIRNWKSGEYKEDMFKRGWMPPHPTLYARKSVYEQYGSFRLDLKIAADYESMLRYIHKNKIKLGYIPEVLVGMRVGGKSNVSLKNRLLANKEDQKAWELNGLRMPWYTPFLKPLRKVVQFF